MKNENQSVNFIIKEFKQYYSNLFIKEKTIDHIEDREFGFQYWDKAFFKRHFSFYDREDLNKFLNDYDLRHCYSSAALYEIPDEKNINEKGWIGCDFVIDIDADHVDLPCQQEHDGYSCKKCGKSGKGKPPKQCSCTNTSFTKFNWVCEKCLDFSKQETIKIIEDFFIPDFGLNKNDFLVKFSGNRGYHIQIQTDSYKKLDQDARREIADYITGKVDLDTLGFKIIKGSLAGPTYIGKGWKKRISRYLITFINDTNKKELNSITRSNLNNILLDNRNKYIDLFKKDFPNWNSIKLSGKYWSKIIQYVINKYAGKIDEPVTTDTRRLLRLPNSLHGKTGLQAKIIGFKNINDFNPLTDAIVFKGTIKIKFKKCPEFTIGSFSYGPYKGGEIESLSKAAGIFAICKGRAELIEVLE